MTTAYSALLGLALPVQGELSGTWGDTVNNYITNYLDAAVAGTQTLTTDADVTLTKTTGVALNGTSSQYAIINCTGARTALRTINAPSTSKTYVVINATTGGFGVKIVGAGPTTGITVAAGEKCLVVWTGSDFAKTASRGVPGDFTTVSASGDISAATNLAFTGTGNRITGDFSNATVANRVMFQSSTVNGNTVVRFISNGASTQSSLQLANSSDASNSSLGVMSATAAEFAINSSVAGTGTYLPMTFYTSGSEKMRIDTSGNVTVTSAAGLGYGTGAGGTVTQATSKSTTVTLNKPTGQITMNNAALAAGATAQFNLNNSLLSATDTLVCNVILADVAIAGNYSLRPCVSAGVAQITIKNESGVSLSESVVINFAKFNGATS